MRGFRLSISLSIILFSDIATSRAEIAASSTRTVKFIENVSHECSARNIPEKINGKEKSVCSIFTKRRSVFNARLRFAGVVVGNFFFALKIGS